MHGLLRANLKWLIVLAFCCSAIAQTEALKPVQLPKPQIEGGMPLMTALNERKSSREFGQQKLPEQVLSSLLWAAFGINRPDGRRTAPSAMNRQEIDIYLVTADATYLYDAKEHMLKPVAAGDFRAQAGTQPYVKDAPVNLIFVADTAKMGGGNDQDKLLYAGADTGYISQNVYLFCASQHLATVARASVDKPALGKVLGLRSEQRIILGQSVGYPK
jgi:SagB-type dehydrogenase family enzyme